jgi:3-oxoacyl-[acyl-carrier-protein] synthase-3
LQQIALLINVGIYRDNNMCEPSMCSQIQHELGLSLEPAAFALPGGTLSFDLMNGACGFLIAVKAASAALGNGTVGRAVVVSSDAHPTGKRAEGFPHPLSGGAVLLEWSAESDRGFGEIEVRTKDIGHEGARGMVNLAEAGRRSRYEIRVTHDEAYVDELLSFSLRAAAEYMEAHAISPGGLKLITSQPSPAFGRELARGLGIDEDGYLGLDAAHGDPHTSALTWGYHLAKERGRLSAGDRVLLVNAGSGLTVACALYQA